MNGQQGCRRLQRSWRGVVDREHPSSPATRPHPLSSMLCLQRCAGFTVPAYISCPSPPSSSPLLKLTLYSFHLFLGSLSRQTPFFLRYSLALRTKGKLRNKHRRRKHKLNPTRDSSGQPQIWIISYHLHLYEYPSCPDCAYSTRSYSQEVTPSRG